MRIITISREFGSGGRELGKRLSDRMGYAYYDREIITAIAQKSEMDEGYVEKVVESGRYHNIPLTFGRTFSFSSSMNQNTTKLLVTQHKVMKELAEKGDCIIVGRGANILLQEYHPFNIFVYADMISKIQRCRERAPENEHLSDHEMQKMIRQVDEKRKNYQELISNIKWGDKQGYHLCLNTGGLEIKELEPVVFEYARFWFGRNEG